MASQITVDANGTIGCCSHRPDCARSAVRLVICIRGRLNWRPLSFPKQAGNVRYWHIADIRGTATFCPLLDKSGHCADLVSVRFLPSDNILLLRPTRPQIEDGGQTHFKFSTSPM